MNLAILPPNYYFFLFAYPTHTLSTCLVFQPHMPRHISKNTPNPKPDTKINGLTRHDTLIKRVGLGLSSLNPFIVLTRHDTFSRSTCRVIPLVPGGLHKGKDSVGEELLMPHDATIHDLKAAAETAMRDTYCIMENLQVDEIVGLEAVIDDGLISSTLESGSEICVRGSGFDLSTTYGLIYVGGADKWVVKCSCGATDDDGEKIVECHLCRMVWMHALCNGPMRSGDMVVCDGCRGKNHVDGGDEGDTHKPIWDIPFSDDELIDLDAVKYDVISYYGDIDDITLIDPCYASHPPSPHKSPRKESDKEKDRLILKLQTQLRDYQRELKRQQIRISKIEDALGICGVEVDIPRVNADSRRSKPFVCRGEGLLDLYAQESF